MSSRKAIWRYQFSMFSFQKSMRHKINGILEKLLTIQAQGPCLQ